MSLDIRLALLDENDYKNFNVFEKTFQNIKNGFASLFLGKNDCAH